MGLFTSKREREATEPPAEFNPQIFVEAHPAEARRWQAWLDARIERGKNEQFTEVVELSPILAGLLLVLNNRNRPLKKSRVARWARAMEEGRWRLHHQGLAVSSVGELADGQHRAHATIASGRTIPMAVTFGIEENAFEVIDAPTSSRSKGDTLALLGYQYSSGLAATAEMVNRLENEQYSGYGSHVLLQNDQIGDYVKEHPKLVPAARMGKLCAEGCKAPPAPLSAAAYLILKKHSEAETKTFFDSVKDGLNLRSKRDPIYLLRKYIAEHWAPGTRTHLGPPHLVAAVIIAFNAWAEKRKPTDIKWNSKHDFPQVV